MKGNRPDRGDEGASQARTPGFYFWTRLCLLLLPALGPALAWASVSLLGKTGTKAPWSSSSLVPRMDDHKIRTHLDTSQPLLAPWVGEAGKARYVHGRVATAGISPFHAWGKGCFFSYPSQGQSSVIPDMGTINCSLPASHRVAGGGALCKARPGPRPSPGKARSAQSFTLIWLSGNLVSLG